MDWKEFFRPTWKKIVIFIILTIVFSVVNTERNCKVFGGVCPKSYGFPFAVYSLSGAVGEPINYQLNYISIILNIIIWYLVSCLILWIYGKIKSKK